MKKKDYLTRIKKVKIYLGTDRYKEALQCARPLIKKHPHLSFSVEEQYEISWVLGNLHTMVGNYTEALNYIYKLRLLILKHRQPSRYFVWITSSIGIVYLNLYQPGRAIMEFNKIDAYYKKYGFNGQLTRENYTRNQINLIQAYLKQNDLARIEDVIKHNFNPCREELLKENIVTTFYYHTLGEYYIRIKKYTPARRLLEKARAVNEKKKHFYMMIADQLHLAVIELMEDQWDKSINRLKAVLAQAHRFNYNDLYTEGVLLLSKVYSLQGKSQLADRTQDKVKNAIKKLDTVWLYEKIKEFDRLYQQLVDLQIISKKKTSSAVPSVLKNQLTLHKDTHACYRIIIGESKPMYQVYEMLDKIAPTDLPVLIEGETGTGKELVARAIHSKSKHPGQPFLAFNCGAIPESLLENELFGHVAGAFTGAQREKKGLIKLADNGTLFFDEIANMPLKMQQKLLRVLDEKKLWPVGGEKPVPVNTRFVFASNKSIKKLVDQKCFRDDLFHRINVIVIALPPLRERKEDILLLARHFLKQYTGGNDVIKFSPEATKNLVDYSWPGNVRELENEIKRICIFNKNIDLIRTAMFSETIQQNLKIQLVAPVITNHSESSLKTITQQVEKKLIIKSLQKFNGSIARAAQELGLTRVGLYKKVCKLKIHKV